MKLTRNKKLYFFARINYHIYSICKIKFYFFINNILIIFILNNIINILFNNEF